MNFSNNLKKLLNIQNNSIYDILHFHSSHGRHASVIQHYIDKIGPIEIDGKYVYYILSYNLVNLKHVKP